MGRVQLVHGHPEAARLAALLDVGVQVHAPRRPRAGRQHRQRPRRHGDVAGHRGAAAIAAVLAGARVGRAEQREQARREKEHPHRQVAGGQVPELVADHEVQLVRPAGRIVAVAGLQQLGIDDDEAAAEQLGREGVEQAAGLDDVGLGHAVHAQLVGRRLDAPHEVRQLARPDAHAVADQVRHEQRVDHPAGQRADDGVGDADDRDQHQQPDHGRDDRRDHEQRSLARRAQVLCQHRGSFVVG